MLRRKSQIINISSNTAQNGTFKSQVLVTFNDCNFTKKDIKNVYLSIQHCEIPNSFYIVNYTNNILIVNGTSYTLQRGNYSATSFATYLLTVLPAGFTITYSNITNRYTISYSTNFTISATSTVKNIMGIGNSDLTSVSNTLTLPNCVNFLPLPRLNFRTNVFRFGSSDIMLSLQNNAPQMGCINYNNVSGTNFYLEDKTITSFVISVTDDAGNLINFNGVDWYMTMHIDMDVIEDENELTFQNILTKNII